MRPSPIKLILLPLLLAAACDAPPAEFGDERRLPRDRRPTVWDAPTRERLGVADVAPPSTPATFAGTTPDGWEEQEPQPQRFRDLVWRVPGDEPAECWLTGSVGGGLTGNMARWYRQFALPMPAADELPEVPFLGGTGQLLELSGSYEGEPDTSMFVVFRANGDQLTTLKLVGPNETARQNREKFLALAASLRMEAGAAGGSGDPQGGRPTDPHGNPHGNPHGAGELTDPFAADVPASWQPKAGSPRSLHHTFGADGAGEVYVSQLSGPLRPNLDIWRAEVGLRQPLSDEEFAAVPRCEMLGPDALWLDVAGTHTSMTGKRIEDARVLVAVRADGNDITFAKLIGPAADVAAEVEAFRSFCASLRRNP